MTHRANGSITLVGEITGTTEKAVQFRETVTGLELWIPRSVLQDGDALEMGDTDLVCARWFADREGLA
jgi:hypothetical protein